MVHLHVCACICVVFVLCGVCGVLCVRCAVYVAYFVSVVCVGGMCVFSCVCVPVGGCASVCIGVVCSVVWVCGGQCG